MGMTFGFGSWRPRWVKLSGCPRNWRCTASMQPMFSGLISQNQKKKGYLSIPKNRLCSLHQKRSDVPETRGEIHKRSAGRSRENKTPRDKKRVTSTESVRCSIDCGLIYTEEPTGGSGSARLSGC